MFVREYSYTLTEHDPNRPWIVLSRAHRTVELADNAQFFEWAAIEHPPARFTVQLDPWQLEPRPDL